MPTRFTLVSSVLLACFSFGALCADDPPLTKLPAATARLVFFDHPDRIAGSYFVGFKKVDEARAALSAFANKQSLALPDLLPVNREVGREIADAMVESGKGKVSAVFERRNGEVRGFWVTMSEEEVRKLAQDPRVEYIEADIVIKTSASDSLPSDNTLWHLDRIDQHPLPLDHTYNRDPTQQGAGAFVFVIDSGARTTHAEFGYMENVVTDCSVVGSTDDCRPTDFSYRYVISDPDEQDCHGHGTAVTSLIAGKTHGVARKAHVKPIKFTIGCTNGGSTASLSRALNVVLHDMYGPQTVLNLSVGFSVPAGGSNPTSVLIEGLIQQILDEDAVVVAAASNDAGSACASSPGRMALSGPLINVGSTNITDQKEADSNYGTCLSLFAPGYGIQAAGIASDTAMDNGWHGTSFASPLVSGIAATYRSAHPTQTNSAVKTAVVNSATSGVLTSIGSGSPNKLAYTLLPGIDPSNVGVPETPAPPAEHKDEAAAGDQKGLMNVLMPYLVI